MNDFKKSPYTIFKEWLCDGNLKSEIPEVALAVVTNLTALTMLCKCSLTIYLNDNYNTFNIMNYDRKEFFMFLKQLIKKNNISIYNLSYINMSKKDSEIEIRKSIHKLYPFLKSFEIEMFINKIKEDKSNLDILEYIEPKQKKLKSLKK